MIHLELGFTRKPLDLTKVLEGHGFELKSTIKAKGVIKERRFYTWFDARRSKKGVSIDYINAIYGNEEGLLELSQNLVAQASITTLSRRSDFDLSKQEEIAGFLRDHYQAVLFNPREKFDAINKAQEESSDRR